MTTGFELGSDGPSVIVLGFDGSPPSLRAGAYAAGLARRHSGLLVVVTVSAPPHTLGLTPGAAGAWEASVEATLIEARKLLEHESERLGFRWELVSRHGDVATELLTVAGAKRADVIVVGASSSPRHRMVGSVPVHLVKVGQFPITVVP